MQQGLRNPLAARLPETTATLSTQLNPDHTWGEKNNRLRRQRGTASSLLTSIVLTWASAVTLTQSSVPQSMFHKCSDWETPLSGLFQKQQGRLSQVVLLLKEEVGREREKRVVTKILQNLETRKRSWRRKCPEEVYAFSLARTHGCPVSRRQTTREKICAGQAPFPETGWVLKRERETRKDRGRERELGQPGGETFHRPLFILKKQLHVTFTLSYDDWSL